MTFCMPQLKTIQFFSWDLLSYAIFSEYLPRLGAYPERTQPQQGHLVYVPRDLEKASIVHIVPGDPMNSIVQ